MMVGCSAKPRLPRRGHLGFAVEARGAPPELVSEGLERWIVSEVDSDPAFDGGAVVSSESRRTESRTVLALGDDLIALNGLRIRSLADLRAYAAAVAPGEVVTLTVLRDGRKVETSRRSITMPVESLRAGRSVLDEVPWAYRNQEYRLRAIWTHPIGFAKAAVWLLPSAAWVTQECPLDATDPTFQLIDFLTEAGLATLRIDRSGLGDSEGPQVSGLDFETELSMWSTGMQYFLQKSQGQRRCLFGRSLGGILAPLVAEEQAIDAICVLGSSSLSWHEAMLESIEHQHYVRQDSVEKTQDSLERVERLQRAVYFDGETPSSARRKQSDLEQVLVSDFSGDLVYDRLAIFFQQLAQVDVAASWSKFHGELLALHSEYDIIVPEKAVKRLSRQASGTSQFGSLLGVDHFMHARSSLREAVEIPWGGSFSVETARTIARFFLRDCSLPL